MINSKPLKETDSEKSPSKLYLWWIESRLSRYWYDYTWKFFGNPVFQVKRLYQWYKNVFKHDYDFDAHCLFAIIEYKLKRVESALKVGHAIHEKQELQSLKLAIKLSGRLKDDKYDTEAMDRHERKWGKSEYWLTPIQDSTSSTWNSSRPKAVFAKDKQQERKEFMERYESAHKKMKREERWLYDIMAKYLRRWWS